MRKILSKSTNPFLNLLYEDKLLRNDEKNKDILFLYINEPSVVFGRFQNPWVEFNVPEAINNKVNIVRRQSGGGTVYHDLGNLNFSFITNSKDINKKQNLEYICNQLKPLGLSIEINSRFDLILDNHKVSGSAFKQTKDGSFHHGTLLVESNLSDLSDILTAKDKKIETKSIPSVRSKVMNLSDKNRLINIKSVADSILGDQFETVLENNDSVEDQCKYSNHSWVFHETPKFTQMLSFHEESYNLSVKKSIIEEVSPSSNQLLNNLVGLEYSSTELIKKIKSFSISNKDKNDLIYMLS